MRGAEFLFGYFLVKVLVCDAEGEPGPLLDGLIMEPGFNYSRAAEDSRTTETPHTEDRCRGYYDVMGQWDPPFTCRTGSYLYCCGTCGFRFCCAFRRSRLDQTTCKNYDTPPWMVSGGAPQKKADAGLDGAMDKTNLIVYVICGVVAVMALVGIFTKLGLEKTHRPHRDNMSRALAQVIRHPATGEHDVIGMHGQHYEHLQARAMANHLQGTQLNNLGAGSALLTHPYPALGQIASPYEEELTNTDLNKYASLKAVAEKTNETLSSRHLVEMTAKGVLPMEPLDMEPEPSNPYSLPRRSSAGHNRHGHKSRSSKTLNSHSPMAYGPGAIPSPTASPGASPAQMLLKGWEGKHQGHYHHPNAPKRHYRGEKELHTIRYIPTQPYFVTNSKTEVTV